MIQQMLGTIHEVLLQLGVGFHADHRPLQLKLTDSLLNENLYLQLLSGHSAINEGLDVKLICLSTHAFIPLKTFIGQTATIEQVTDRGQQHRIGGIITEAAIGHSDGGFTVYQLRLQDSFSSLLAKRLNSRVFMQKSVLDITRIIFTEWQQHSALFGKSLKLDSGQLGSLQDVRPFTMQSHESDFEFLTRLWRSEGINWFIDSTLGEQHQLTLFNEAKTLAQLPAQTIRFHLNQGTAQRDTITQLTSHRQLQSSHIHLQRWSQPHGTVDEQATVSAGQQSKTYSSASLNLEQAWHIGAGATDDLDAQDHNTLPSQQQLVRLGELLLQRQQLEAKSFTASGTVRDVKVGYWFNLTDHPELDTHPASERQFLISQLRFFARNNLPKQLNAQVMSLIAHSQWTNNELPAIAQPPHQVEMTLIRRDIAIVPFYDPLVHRAKAYPMRARVVGPASETIHVDAWGRIKVQFLFARVEDHQHSGGAGSSGSDSDSAWVEVLTPWAGDGESSYGARFLPRVGELVAIDFFDGNIDRPFVIGRLHEGSRTPAQFDHQGKLPDTRHLSGIKTQEISGQGFNQLRFDDTTGQISAQLHSSHAASQLNLGNLSQPKQTETSAGRGKGFELRTDQFGAIRAGQGLLISTNPQEQAKGNHLDAQAAKSQIEGSLNNAKVLSEMAKNQQIDPLEVLENIQAFIEQFNQEDAEKAATFKAAIMLLTSPSSIALSSNADIHVSADGQISHSADDSINISTQSSLIAQARSKISLFAAQQGIRAFAAKGKVELQAQDDAIEAIARKVIKLISTEDRIEITSPKEMVVNAGGSQLMINASGVFIKTGGKFESKAGQHVFSGGQAANVQTIPLKQLKCNVQSQEAAEKGSPLIKVR